MFLDLFSKYKISLKDELKKLFQLLKQNFWHLIYIIIFISAIISLISLTINYIHEAKHVTLKNIKDCFYSEVSRLSVQNKIILTELELMNIQNPQNIIHSDGKFYKDVSQLETLSQFKVYLKNNNIKYITNTPLSSDVPYNEANAQNRFVKEMVKERSLLVHKDCVVENHIDNTKLPYLENEDIPNWLIYKVDF